MIVLRQMPIIKALASSMDLIKSNVMDLIKSSIKDPVKDIIMTILRKRNSQAQSSSKEINIKIII